MRQITPYLSEESKSLGLLRYQINQISGCNVCLFSTYFLLIFSLFLLFFLFNDFFFLFFIFFFKKENFLTNFKKKKRNVQLMKIQREKQVIINIQELMVPLLLIFLKNLINKIKFNLIVFVVMNVN